MQIGRIFRGRRARLPSWRCWRKWVLLGSQWRELALLWRHHDDLGHRSDGCRRSRHVLLPPPPSKLSRLLNSKQVKQVNWYSKDCSISCYNSVAPKLGEFSIEHEMPAALSLPARLQIFSTSSVLSQIFLRLATTEWPH